jgi:hypothetical protein
MPPLQDVSDSDDKIREKNKPEEIQTAEEVNEKFSLTAERIQLIAAVATTSDDRELDIYDSGATQHLTPSRNRLLNFQKIEPRGIVAADNKKFEANGKGDMYINVPDKNKQSTRVLVKDVLYAPSMGVTLLSVGRITQASYKLHFRSTDCKIFDQRGRRIGIIPFAHGVYCVEAPQPELRAYSADDAPLVATPEELHRLLSHIPIEAARTLVRNKFIEGIELDETGPTPPKDCESCLHGRMTRKPISKPAEREAKGEVGDEIHTDVWGPASVETPQHNRYYVSFTDEASRYSVVVLMHAKSDTFDALKTLVARWERESGLKIKVLHSDNGGECKNKEFDKYLAEHGIQRRLTARHARV